MAIQPVQPYCNITTDLQRAFSKIETYQQKRSVQDWTVVSGNAATFSHVGTGYVGGVFSDNVALAIKTSIATVQATAQTFWYDSTNDILYVHITGDADPDTVVIDVQHYDTWANYKQQAVYDAMNELENMLDPKFSRPLPPMVRSYKISATTETRDYDYDITYSCAVLTCKNIIAGLNASDPNISALMSLLINEDETGIIDEHRNGSRSFSFEITGDHQISAEPTTLTGSGVLLVRGPYTGLDRQIFVIEITTGGAVDASSTPVYKISLDGGNTFPITNQIGSISYKGIQNNVSIAFDSGDGNFTAGDIWRIDLKPAGWSPENSNVKSVSFRRGRMINQVDLV